MSNENEENPRLREFISAPVNLSTFLNDAIDVKQRISSLCTNDDCTELVDLAKSLADFRHHEPAGQQDDEQTAAASTRRESEIDEDDDLTTSTVDEAPTTTWRTRRKTKKLDSTLYNNLKSYPACIEYLLSEFSQSRPHAAHDTAFLKNIRECNLANSNINDPTLVLHLQIFFPAESRDRYRHQLMNELICLSTSTLANIRDAIECVSDEQIIGEYSERPDEIKENGHRAGDTNTAGCFIIDSIIYDDLRRTDFRLSDIILSTSNIYHQGTTMEMTTLNNLDSICLGKPYIYLHQTNCEHVIIFSELKLLEADQCHDSSLYPLCRMKYHGRFSYCFLCNVFYAKWLVRDSPLIPDDPCLLCERCFKASHYDSTSNKVGNFSAYHFPQL